MAFASRALLRAGALNVLAGLRASDTVTAGTAARERGEAPPPAMSHVGTDSNCCSATKSSASRY